MKFFLPLALLAAVSATAQQVTDADKECDAIHIVESCLSSELKKLSDCRPADYDCECRASEAIATCFNNCPNDSRAGSYRSQVTIHCGNASVHGTAARKIASSTGSAAAATESASASPTPTSQDDDEPASTTFSQGDASSTPNVGVGHIARNTGGVLLAVAGVVAAAL